MTIIKVLFGLITAILRAATSSLLMLVSTLITTLAVLALVGFLGLSLTGVVSLRLSRRRGRRNQP